MGKKQKSKSWKAVTMDWSALQSYDDIETYGVCLTQRKAAILKALLTTAYWRSRWTNLTIDNDEFDAYISNIDNLLDGNDCEIETMLFRDNPDDACEVQFSTNGGASWATMFRKDNCSPNQEPSKIDQTYIDIDTVTTNNTIYDGDILNVAPDWAYVGEDSDKALCWAIDFYVEMICELAIKEIETLNVDAHDDTDFLNDISDIVTTGIIAAISATATTPIVVPAVVVGALGWAVSRGADALYDWWVTTPDDDYRDEDAKQLIKCTMYEAVQGGVPAWADWRDSLQYHESYEGAYKSIGYSVNKVNQELDTFINYMILVEDINSVADTLPACPCPDRWEHTWNFVTHGFDTWQLSQLGDTPPLGGVLTPGVGAENTHVIEGNNRHSMLVRFLVLLEEIPRLTDIEFTNDYVKGTWDVVTTCLAMGDGVIFRFENMGILLASDDDAVWPYNFPERVGPRIQIMFRTADYSPGPEQPNGSSEIKSITLKGNGTDPFAGRETS